ncbi:SufE family protein [Aquipuribacter hungaricus]|uniref:SufE family protein n=1 Tax=Aquipuribacter hungaricus TaxID=545624 RepID=A0ABV7WD76_9MICO
MSDGTLPGRFDAVVEDFGALEQQDRLVLLLEFADGLPELPEHLASHREVMEVVPECQSPVFVHVEVEGTGPQAPVHVYLSAPREAPTTRGFAAILAEGMTGLDAAGVLAVPDDVPHRLGLERAVSMLRLRGMSGMLGRIQRQVREKAAV